MTRTNAYTAQLAEHTAKAMARLEALHEVDRQDEWDTDFVLFTHEGLYTAPGTWDYGLPR